MHGQLFEIIERLTQGLENNGPGLPPHHDRPAGFRRTSLLQSDIAEMPYVREGETILWLVGNGEIL